MGDFLFGHEGEVVYLVVGVDEEDFVGVSAEAAALGGDVVGDDQVEALLRYLGSGVFQQVIAFGGEARLAPSGRVAWARMSSVFSKSMLHWEELFLTLEDATDVGPVVGDGGGHYQGVGLGTSLPAPPASSPPPSLRASSPPPRGQGVPAQLTPAPHVRHGPLLLRPRHSPSCLRSGW